MKCEVCGKKMDEQYRFTDWENDYNDIYGILEECKKVFNKVVKENPKGRFSIYDISYCPNCDEQKDEGIIFNKKCPEYQ